MAAGTERIRIGTMVTNAAMRHPAVLATSILTVDQISGGRVVTAIGGGYYPAEHAATRRDGTLGAENQGIETSLPAFRARMARADEICSEEGRDPSTLRRCYFAGWADEPIFASTEAATDIIGRYVDAGATDFTFYLHHPDDPVMAGFVVGQRAGSRAQFERLATEVFPRF